MPDAAAIDRRDSVLIRLTAGDYTATVTTVGGALVDLAHRGRPLVRAIDAKPPRPRFRGAVLAPWPNRIRDGRWTYRGTHLQLPINEPERGCALHGLLLWHGWRLEDAGTRSAVLRDVLWPQQGYPFQVSVTVRYELDAQHGLRTTVRAVNEGTDTAPFGTAAHPYVVAGGGGVDDWTLRLAARSVLRVDPQRLLPLGSEPVADGALDFRAGRSLGATVLDHTFGEVDAGRGSDLDPATAHADVTSTVDGHGVRVSWDADSPWVQLHTTEDPGTPWHRSALAVEPMTCPPDAFNSGIGLWHLAPGEQRDVSWAIADIPVGSP